MRTNTRGRRSRDGSGETGGDERLEVLLERSCPTEAPAVPLATSGLGCGDARAISSVTAAAVATAEATASATDCAGS